MNQIILVFYLLILIVLNSNLTLMMDIEGQNILRIKKFNRRIVERAFHKSTINQDFIFPKQQLSIKDDDLTDLISLKSKVSQMYDLNEQNNNRNQKRQNNRPIISITNLLKKRKTEKMIYKSQQQNAQNNKQDTSKKSKSRKKYLSLTPRKQQILNKSFSFNHQVQNQRYKHFQKVSSMNISINKKLDTIQQGIQKESRSSIKAHSSKKSINKLSLPEQIIKSMRRIASKCFSEEISFQNHKNQARFIDESVHFSRESFAQKNKLHEESRTTDSTPNVNYRKITPKNASNSTNQRNFETKNNLISSFSLI